MTTDASDLDRILDAAGDVIMNDGYDAVSVGRIAQRADIAPERIAALFPSTADVLVSMLNREFAAMYRGIVDHIERDERGGLLSRIYLYTLSTIYERPLAKTLFVIDRDALNAIMRHSHSFSYVPQIGVRAEMIERLQQAGMVRPEVDARAVSYAISTYSAGIAITAPHDDLDVVIRGFCDLLSRSVDAAVDDTRPGKIVYYDWASSLTVRTARSSDDAR
ncbi:TetR/AcrR family transcriptional regulator [Microcella daejeonensis]|uniref:TetR/AcrR family transcriptional regulator n=1 Tax=Microcella daejeonensis TaxID=2994971 RepID=A0A9E8MKX7_9MICO|nr:TetR/AcrR family transcriptional regulator [Microcella daejeonensis]WAB80671.1 TetR/AcrR family transcriptional regulator [Microcella daejeonensis]WAB82854.1 TetR/AcrR family transcriptional regulator [Microcella daejeonensis]